MFAINKLFLKSIMQIGKKNLILRLNGKKWPLKSCRSHREKIRILIRTHHLAILVLILRLVLAAYNFF